MLWQRLLHFPGFSHAAGKPLLTPQSPPLHSEICSAWENNCAQHGCTVDAATVYELQKGQALPPKAQAIVDASGPRAAVRAAAARGEWA